MKRGLVLTTFIIFIFVTLFYLAYRSHPPAPEGEEHASQNYVSSYA